ncbi:hypothetical protein BSLG_006273 [Batrachochytrium salamandrivorans]|nr:hypothetical protein BSLG_006273 [Batrachochytrium salamandrivorans]
MVSYLGTHFFPSSNSEKVATKFLKNNAWNLEVSVNDYFQAMGGQSPNTQSSSSAKASLVAALFDKYKDPEEDAILLEGTEALCRDLALDPADVVVLVLAFHLKCENICDNISSMKAAVETMRQELDDPQKAKAVYMFTFGFAKQSTQKGLALNLAFAFWDLLLRDKYEHLDLWKQFLEETHGKSITKDTWSLPWSGIGFLLAL